MADLSILNSAAVTMSSREIAELTGKELSNVHRDIRSMLVALYGQEHVDRVAPEQYRNRQSEYIRENAEAILSAITGSDSKQNHQDQRGFSWVRDARGYITTFRLDHNHAMTLVTGYSVKLRKVIIDRWQELEAKAAGPALPDFTNPAIAARAWADAIEQKQVVEAQAVQARQQLAIAAPKVEALDRIANADGSTCITDAAKVLQARPKDLFQWLQAQQWIYRRPGGSGWLAYQNRIQQGYLEHKVTTVERGDGSEKVIEAVRVTRKGLAHLAEVMCVQKKAA